MKNRKHEQRLLRNMGAHTVVLELLQIPYEKVNCSKAQINFRFSVPKKTRAITSANQEKEKCHEEPIRTRSKKPGCNLHKARENARD